MDKAEGIVPKSPIEGCQLRRHSRGRRVGYQPDAPARVFSNRRKDLRHPSLARRAGMRSTGTCQARVLVKPPSWNDPTLNAESGIGDRAVGDRPGGSRPERFPHRGPGGEWRCWKRLRMADPTRKSAGWGRTRNGGGRDVADARPEPGRYWKESNLGPTPNGPGLTPDGPVSEKKPTERGSGSTHRYRVG